MVDNVRNSAENKSDVRNVHENAEADQDSTEVVSQFHNQSITRIGRILNRVFHKDE